MKTLTQIKCSDIINVLAPSGRRRRMLMRNQSEKKGWGLSTIFKTNHSPITDAQYLY